MNLESQVVTRPLAEQLRDKLKSVDVGVETSHSWAILRDGYVLFPSDGVEVRSALTGTLNDIILDIIPAPTLSEMLELLPAYITVKEIGSLSLILDMHSKRICYEWQDSHGTLHNLGDSDQYFDKIKIEDAVAQEIIWLIDNKYYTGGK